MCKIKFVQKRGNENGRKRSDIKGNELRQSRGRKKGEDEVGRLGGRVLDPDLLM